MDRKSLIGLLLIGALLIGYSIWTRPSEEQRLEDARKSDSIQNVQAEQQKEALRLELLRNELEKDEVVVQEPESQKNQLKHDLGGFAESALGEEKFVTLENQFIRVKISSKGGHVYSAELKEYLTWDKKPLMLFDNDDHKFNLKFYAEGKPIFTEDLYFLPQSNDGLIDASSSARSLTMRLDAGEGRWIDFVYTLEPESYELGFDIKLNKMNEVFGRNMPYIDLDWSYPLKQQERGHKFESQYSSIYYKYWENEVGHLGARKESEDLTTKVEWIGFKQQFFSSVLRTDNYFTSAKIASSALEEESGYIKLYEAAISIPIEGTSEESIPMSFYFLPNKVKSLKNIGFEFDGMIDMGWPFISWINTIFVVNIFHFLEGVFDFKWKYGLIIIILTIFFKTILLPLSYKSFVSGAKMRVLKPQIDEINAKFTKDKAMEKQQATMALYKKAGVNPMGGCLPMLLQMPIWLALFRFFPASIELRQQSFLWATDLSSYDSIVTLPFTIPAYGDHISLFTLLMAVSMALTTKANMSQTDTGQQMPGMKMMMYMMPVMMLLWFNSYASGLSFYYFVSNLITFLQMYLIKRNINEEKILKKLTLNQKKPQKKSNFQSRLEKMARERQKLNSPKKK